MDVVLLKPAVHGDHVAHDPSPASVDSLWCVGLDLGGRVGVHDFTLDHIAVISQIAVQQRGASPNSGLQFVEGSHNSLAAFNKTIGERTQSRGPARSVAGRVDGTIGVVGDVFCRYTPLQPTARCLSDRKDYPSLLVIEPLDENLVARLNRAFLGHLA
jgi:hypothetical protein